MGFFVVNDVHEKRVADGVRVKAITGEKMTMAFFHLEPGAVVLEHSHPHEQMGTVLRGSVSLNLGGEERMVGEGEGYHILPNVPHSARCAKGPAQIVEVFSPPRVDLQE